MARTVITIYLTAYPNLDVIVEATSHVTGCPNTGYCANFGMIADESMNLDVRCATVMARATAAPSASRNIFLARYVSIGMSTAFTPKSRLGPQTRNAHVSITYLQTFDVNSSELKATVARHA